MLAFFLACSGSATLRPFRARCAVNQVAHAAGANVPLHSAEHFYIITEPIRGASSEIPVLRDPDALFYMREWSGGLCVGGFELKAKPIFEVYRWQCRPE